ncbi:MAG: rhomboid family intramembrane serine protease [Kofleriaceae bacterium]
MTPPPQAGDEWIEKIVRVAAWLGFNPMRTRWKLLRWQNARAKARRRREQVVDHIRYEHKTCGECGAVQDREAVTCSRCDAKLDRHQLQVFRRIGLAMPSFVSMTVLLGLVITGIHARAMLASAQPMLSIPGYVVDALGARLPSSLEYEPWRLVASIFLHLSLWHLGFNLLAIASIGPRIEALYDRLTMLFLFVATGVVASVAVCFVADYSSAGASGGLMGLIGVAAGAGHRRGTRADLDLRNQMLKWCAYTFGFGFVLGADNWAHLFGLIAGILFGYAVRPEAWRATRVRFVRRSAKLVGAVVALGAVAMILSRPIPEPAERGMASVGLSQELCERVIRGHEATLAADGQAASPTSTEQVRLSEYHDLALQCAAWLAGQLDRAVCAQLERAPVPRAPVE